MIARIVERLDAEWRARRSTRTVILCGELDDDRLSGLRLIEPFDREARDEPRRQMEQHIDDALHPQPRSEEHTSELQSLMRISYAVFCLKKQKQYSNNICYSKQH